LATVFLAIQGPERVDLVTLVAIRAELVQDAAQESLQGLPVRRPAPGTPHGIQVKFGIGEAEFGQVGQAEGEDLHIDGGVLGSDDFDAGLMVLAVAAPLLPFVAEDGAEVKKLMDFGAAIKLMLEVSSDHGSCSLRPEGHTASSPVLEGIHLFGNYIRSCSHAADEQVGFFEDRGPDFGEAEALANVPEEGFDGLPFLRLPDPVLRGSGGIRFAREEILGPGRFFIFQGHVNSSKQDRVRDILAQFGKIVKVAGPQRLRRSHSTG
jgi:hypothetical protein